MRKKVICFYARLPDRKLFETTDFYSTDIKLFRDLGYKVVTASKLSEIVKADLYFVWWWSSGVIPLLIGRYLFRKKVIMIGNTHLHDNSLQGYKYRPFYVKWFIRFSLKCSDLQIATSKIEYDDLVNFFKASNPFLLYHSIDKEKYKYFDGEKDNYIITISRLIKLNIERKKIFEIIDAFILLLHDFPDYKLIIVGRKEDDGYNDVLKYIHKLKMESKIIFTGSVSDEEKINLLQKSKIYVQPTEYEGFGLAIAESMLCGTPVVTSFRGAVKEVVGEFALNANPNDPHDIYLNIKRLIDDNNLYREYQTKGSKRIRELFSIEKRKEVISELIKKYI